ncbi:MAG TPA: RimK family alpha-L-glutamate ligase [Bacillota bacterium]|nr:RimK family alpha-L-glutamate ligase [Bacillota bacterium]
MPLHGWIIYNGHLPGDKFLNQAKLFEKAALDRGLSVTIVKNNAVLSLLDTHTTDILQVEHGKLPDFVIFKDKDIYLAKQLELLGIKVFNSASAIEISDDKIATYQVLAQKDIPIPKTIIAPKIFPVETELDPIFINRVIETLGFPLIMKEAFGSFGEQVYLIHNEEEMLNKITALKDRPYVFQQFIKTSFGRDLRLHVVGDKVAASMYRKTEDDFRSTAGGIRLAYEPTKEEAALAIAATKAIGADFAGVDLLFGTDDEHIVCEVNSNAHIGKLLNCTKINVAEHVIDYIIEVLST